MKLYFNKELIKPSSELVLIAPLVKDLFKNESRFKQALNYGDKFVSFSEIEDCDYVVLPYKWDKNNIYNNKTINEAKKHNKKVLIFHIDDSDESIDVENCYVFRTSFYKSKQKDFEYSFPCFKDDNFDFNYLTTPSLSIGFCGQNITPVRQAIIKKLQSSDIQTNFIIRNVGWPGIEYGKTKETIIQEFYENMSTNIFNLCIRGGGNFSYRLYETMMMGRIPIIVDTDIVLPYEDLINWSNSAVIIKENDDNIVDKIKNFYKEKNLLDIQKNNREIWEEYLSPLGVIKNILKTLK
jgi:hypothetical protein